MTHKLSLEHINNKKLSQFVIQAAEMLALYNAELARILCLHCADIGELASGKEYLEENSLSWTQAELFILFYNNLYDYFEGNGVMMRHWLRVKDNFLGDTPFILIVDKNKLKEVNLHLTKISRHET